VTALRVLKSDPGGDEQVLEAFEMHMRRARLSPATIGARMELVLRLAKWLLPVSLLAATPEDLERFQDAFVHLSRASHDIYTRHVQAFYRWATLYGHVTSDPSFRMIKIDVKRGLPHPISPADLRMLLACGRDGLRMAYVLAAFAGLRAGEIARLRGEDMQMDAAQPVALIHGKGEKERMVPLLPPVIAELRAAGFPRSGYVATRRNGKPYTPERLSTDSSQFMCVLGIDSTLHSCRHFFASEIVKLTKDILLVRDLLGHSSVATTQIYTLSTIDGAEDRLSEFSSGAVDLIANLEAVAVPAAGMSPEQVRQRAAMLRHVAAQLDATASEPPSTG
jgi:integrase